MKKAQNPAPLAWVLEKEAAPQTFKRYLEESESMFQEALGSLPKLTLHCITLAAASSGVCDLLLDYHWIGTESLAWPLYRTRHFPKLSLAELCRYLGVPEEPLPHNALNGAHACHRVYAALLARYENFVDERLGVLSPLREGQSSHRLRHNRLS
jgi:hypothetical protein